MSEDLRAEDGDCPRMKALKEALQQGVEKVLGAWRVSNLAKLFPSLACGNEAVLEAMRSSAVETVRGAIYQDLREMIDEYVGGSLEELGALVRTYTGPKDCPAWRPSGQPLQDVRAPTARVLEHERTRLLESLEAERAKSEELLQHVKAGRKQVLDNQREVERRMGVLRDVAGAGARVSQEALVTFHAQVLAPPSM